MIFTTTTTIINFDNDIVPDLLSSVIFQQFTYTNSQKKVLHLPENS